MYRTDPTTPAAVHMTESFNNILSGSLSISVRTTTHIQIAEQFHSTSILLKALIALKRHRYIQHLRKKQRNLSKIA